MNCFTPVSYTHLIREMEEGLQGMLYIACVEGCAPRLFAEWISSFQKKYPHVQYNLWNGNSDDVSSRVTKGLCEIAMITAPYNKESFEVLPVWTAVSYTHLDVYKRQFRTRPIRVHST